MNRNIIDSLIAWKSRKNRKPLILRGARQVGKTYILKEFGTTHYRNVAYVNFEESERLASVFSGDLKPGKILEGLQFYLNKEISRQDDLLILDEIQRVPRAITSLKYFAEEMPELSICAAGSLPGVMLNEESFPVGKVTFLDLHPMTFTEFLRGIGCAGLADAIRDYNIGTPLPDMAHEVLWERWKQYLVVGGLPEAVKCFADNGDDIFRACSKVRLIQKDLLDSYMADIAKHSGKIKAMHIERLWKNTVEQLARNQDGSSQKFKFRDAIPGIRGYEKLAGPLDWLEKANLATRVSIVESAPLPLKSVRHENTFKLLFFDTGLLTNMAEIPASTLLQYGFGSYQGYLAENYVAQEFKAAGIESLYCWQGRTSEIEFLLQTAQGVLPVEVKSGKVIHSKSLSVYESKYSPVRSFMLSARNISSGNLRCHVPIYMAGRLADMTRVS